MILQHLAVWTHILSAIGSFGGLLALHAALPADCRRSATLPLLRFTTLLLAIAFIAGLAAYYAAVTAAASSGSPLPSAYHMHVGIKFLCLLGIGACLGMATAKTRRHADANTTPLRLTALLLYAVAAFLAVTGLARS